jgi:hypothetical protein
MEIGTLGTELLSIRDMPSGWFGMCNLGYSSVGDA